MSEGVKVFILMFHFSEVLQDRWVTNQRFSWKLRLKMAIDIARGMQFLHTYPKPPVIHRDLRSPNIFVVSLNFDEERGCESTEVNCKVADFGLSQQVFTKLTEVLLTWQWMAPEVIEPEGAYDERADIYSYGILLWEIATREFPYWEYDHLKDVHVRKLTYEQTLDENLTTFLESNGWSVDPKKLEATKVQFKRHKGIELILNVCYFSFACKNFKRV